MDNYRAVDAGFHMLGTGEGPPDSGPSVTTAWIPGRVTGLSNRTAAAQAAAWVPKEAFLVKALTLVLTTQRLSPDAEILLDKLLQLDTDVQLEFFEKALGNTSEARRQQVINLTQANLSRAEDALVALAEGNDFGPPSPTPSGLSSSALIPDTESVDGLYAAWTDAVDGVRASPPPPPSATPSGQSSPESVDTMFADMMASYQPLHARTDADRIARSTGAGGGKPRPKRKSKRNRRRRTRRKKGKPYRNGG